jgi:hypothetical protein
MVVVGVVVTLLVTVLVGRHVVVGAAGEPLTRTGTDKEARTK